MVVKVVRWVEVKMRRRVWISDERRRREGTNGGEGGGEGKEGKERRLRLTSKGYG